MLTSHASPEIEVADASAAPVVDATVLPTPDPTGPAGRPRRPMESIDYFGRHLVLVGLTPAGLFGIAVGATAVVLNLADAAVHLAGIAIIWAAAVIVSVLSIVAGMREAAAYSRRSTRNDDAVETKTSPAALESTKPEDRPNTPTRYQSLKSINPEP